MRKGKRVKEVSEATRYHFWTSKAGTRYKYDREEKKRYRYDVDTVAWVLDPLPTAKVIEKWTRRVTIFAYGKLTSPVIQEWVLNAEKTGTKADLGQDILEGFRLWQYKGTGILFILPSEDGQGEVTGNLYSIPRILLSDLDDYEGPAYKRQRAVTATKKRVYVYVQSPAYRTAAKGKDNENK